MIDLTLKKYELPIDSFIQGWYIPETICDDMINFFTKHKDLWVQGKISDSVQQDKKKSTDLYVNHLANEEPILSYRQHLQWCLEQYVNLYPELMKSAYFNINTDFNIQYYNLNEGFKDYHYERSNISSCLRNLVFMTYLNDVEDGGTQFKYQNLTTPAKKGLTILWPTDFTHTHRGVISQTKEKYIVTGWYTYTPPKEGEI